MSIILNAINYFWKLGFNEVIPDRYVKHYSDSQQISLDIAAEVMDYGKGIKICDEKLRHFSQMNFIVLEAIDRALRKGYQPEDIDLGRSTTYHYAIMGTFGDVFVALRCHEWEQ